jgi:DNA-directed RNA polymerase specialized sigma24 family protein
MEVKPSAVERDARPKPHRSRWVLNRPAFERLLSSLDADQERAPQQYERLRQKLIIFFSGRRCPDPEMSADETLDRISRRIEEGEPIRDVTRFAYGVARLVASESSRAVRRRHRLLTAIATSSALARGSDSAATLGSDAVECIQGCMRRLSPQDRDLISHYYESGGHDQQEERRQLAARLGLSAVALRLRAFRIRRALQACTVDCLACQGPGET